MRYFKCDKYIKLNVPRHTRAGIAQSVLRRAAGWMTGVRFPTGVRDFSLVRSVLTDTGVHQTFNPMGTGGSLPRVKLPGREADHSPPSSTEVKNGRAIPPLPSKSSYCAA
jgi:hypothetical protein